MSIRSQTRWLALPAATDVRYYGVSGDGLPDDQPPIQAAFDDGGSIFVPYGTYNLSSDAVYGPIGSNVNTVVNGQFTADPGMSLGGAGLVDLTALIPLQTHPNFGLNVTRRHYGADFASYLNIYQSAHTLILEPDGPVRGVAHYSMGVSKASGKAAWAENPTVIATASGAIALANETDVGLLAAGAVGYGITVAATGNGTENVQFAYGIQGNNPGAKFLAGIKFDNGDQNIVTQSMIEALLVDGCARLFYSRGFYGTMEFDTPGIAVYPGEDFGARFSARAGNSSVRIGADAITQSGGTAATDADLIVHSLGTGAVQLRTSGGTGPVAFEAAHVASATNYMRALGSAGSTPGFRAVGSSADLNADIWGKGTGGGRGRDGAGNVRIHFNAAGLGFHGATPVGQSTGWGAPTGTADKSAFDTSTVTLEELAERVKAMIDYALLRGDYGA